MIKSFNINIVQGPLNCLLTTSGHSNLITCLTRFFEKKNPVRLQKKKKVDFGVKVTDESGLEIFCQTQKKAFKIFIVRTKYFG